MYEKVRFIKKMSDHVFYGRLLLEKDSLVLYSSKNVRMLDEKVHYFPKEDLLEVVREDSEWYVEPNLDVGEVREFKNEKLAKEYIEKQMDILRNKNVVITAFTLEESGKKYIVSRVK